MTNDSTHQIESTIHGLTSGIAKTVAKMSVSLEQTGLVKHQTKDVVNAEDKQKASILLIR
ncbi:hypothetical protein BCU90_12925 [Vibrio lentus]|nr:hypothetical protein BCU90_12925 [Vibrio lentus]PMG73437.1 hypothetical protein BCU85_16745 [Vibrio lentus]PMK90898.1 hypothetical protein BCT88_01300 [Vibrio lentus]PML21911.1 hypothetical protein BCT80_07955 [Vibrio lentus]PMM29210.1 hypothetical protein BCT57_00215 [Vibrio lentus]